MAPKLTKALIDSRLKILRSGYRSFVNPIKTPLSVEHKWLLEIVCIHEPLIAPVGNGQISIYEKADNYLQNFLWNYQTQINQQREEWIKSKKEGI